MKRTVVSVLTLLAPVAALWCGGTTGQGASPGDGANGADATMPDGGAGADAMTGDASVNTGMFDVDIPYADRVLPDVLVAPEGGQDAGPSLPDCPPFLPVSKETGKVQSLGNEDDQVPAVTGGDGGEVFAPDGSVCATYPWLGSVAIDQCVTQSAAGGPQDFYFLPPCNWAVDAGVAVRGTGTGESRYDLCIALYQCFMGTQCYLHSFSPTGAEWCFCGVGTSASGDCLTTPQGACVAQEWAALELDPSTPPAQALANFSTIGSADPGWPAKTLNAVFDNYLAVVPGSPSPCTTLALQRLDGGPASAGN